MLKTITGSFKKILLVVAVILFTFSMITFTSPGKMYGASPFTDGDGNIWTYDTAGAITDFALNATPTKTDITIPVTLEGTTVTSIGANAFRNQAITSVTFDSPSSVTSIGGSAFYSCSALTSITIPSSVTSIGDEAFRSCTSLTSITIPDSVTIIEYGAFWSCTKLASIDIPDTVTSIGDYAFSNCANLTSITIPDSVTSIGDFAFRGCTSLASVTFTPTSSVRSIGVGAFRDCRSLTSITIPDSVTSIGASAFNGCTSLISATILKSDTTIGTNAFTEPAAPAILTISGYEGSTEQKLMQTLVLLIV